MNKTISRNIQGMPTSDGAGVNLTRIIGQPAQRNLDPFLMLDEIRSDNASDYIAGFPPHPHKGFETLSYMITGSMAHKDSTGGEGLITSGGVQYMTAGKGIIHSETPMQESGLLFGFQLWINLAQKDKLNPAAYVDIPAAEIPIVSDFKGLEGSGSVKIIAGQIETDSQGETTANGPVVRSDIDLSILDVNLEGNSQATFSFSPDTVGFVYVYSGSIKIDGKQIVTKQAGIFGEGDSLNIEASEDAGFLLLNARPIGEPIAQYGPFVMNTMEEIDQALRDYQSGNFV